MRRKLHKLRRTSFDELRVRGTQALAAFAERRSWGSLSKLPSDQELQRLLRTDVDLNLRHHFEKRTSPPFFPSFDNLAATIDELRRRWPNGESHIIEHADRIVEGKFDLLGLKNISFGDPIDWHLEPVAGKRAPLLHWSRLDYLDAATAGDKKITWELNRHQHFITLGQAYCLTNDERYARTFDSQINSWMDANPPKLGINWASSLEVAFRSIAWIWALYFFRHSSEVSNETHVRIWKFLYLHARHVETYLSTYFSPNTHLTGEALGLFYIGTVFPEFSEAGRWRAKGLTILLAQLERHVQPDGVYFEQSTYYHRYTTDFYLHLLILLRASGESFPAELKSKLTLLLEHLMYITRPDGTTPLIGDDDGGRLVKLDRCESNDFRATLSTGAAVFERGDLKFVAGGVAEETLWLLGPSGLSQLDQITAVAPTRQSVAFHDGGYYVMRDGWSTDSNYLFFDCGPHGVDNCGHAHADALSFDLAANGRTLLVDPGTFTYTGSAQLRDWFRSSGAHNTLTVNQSSSSLLSGPFSWATTAGSELLSWLSHNRFDYVSGFHDGFEHLPSAAMHRRAILFLKKDYWVMLDGVSLRNEANLQLWFHFDAQVAPLKGKNSLEVISGNGHATRLQLFTFGSGGHWSTEEGWVSHCYGEKQEAPVFSYSVLSRHSEELVTFLLPETAGSYVRPVVREIEAIDGRGFEINQENKHDVLLLPGIRQGVFGDAEVSLRVETARMASDFQVTWVRFANEHARMPDEVILIGGHQFELEGRKILNSRRQISYLVATRVGEQYRVETEDGVLDLSSLTIGDPEELFGRAESQEQEL